MENIAAMYEAEAKVCGNAVIFRIAKLQQVWMQVIQLWRQLMRFKLFRRRLFELGQT